LQGRGYASPPVFFEEEALSNRRERKEGEGKEHCKVEARPLPLSSLTRKL
jgi:hypothetical protein